MAGPVDTKVCKKSCQWQICLFLSGSQKTEEIIIRIKFHDKTEQEYTAAHKEHHKDGCLQMEQVSYKDAKSRQDPPGNVCPDLYRNVSEPPAYKDKFAEGFGKGLDAQAVQCKQRIACMTAKMRSIRKIAASRKTLSAFS